jgi:hypothetical protein
LVAGHRILISHFFGQPRGLLYSRWTVERPTQTVFVAVHYLGTSTQLANLVDRTSTTRILRFLQPNRAFVEPMYASDIPDDPIYDNYIDPAVYAYPTTDAAFLPLEAGSFDISTYALPQADRRIPATPAPGAPQPQHTCIDPAQHKTNPIYFLDLEAFEHELHTTFGKNHEENVLDENDMLEPSQTLSIEGLNNSVFPFSADDVSGVWFNMDGSVSTASPVEYTATFCHSPSTKSTSDFEYLLSDVTLTSSEHTIDSYSNLCRRKRSISSNPGSGLSQSQTRSTRSLSSDQNCSGLYFCRLCNRSFTLSKDLKRHTSTIHDKERWPCLEPGCRYGNRGFSRRDKLLQHRRIHIDIKENTTSSHPSNVLYEGALSYDTKSTTTSTEIREECIDSRRLEEEPPSAAPSSSSHLNDGKKPFKCLHCPQGFKYQHDRVRHLRTLHSKQENGVQYRCAALKCTNKDKIWTRLDNFQKHLAQQHGVENVQNLVEQSRRDGTGNAFTVTTPDMFAQ